MFFNNPKDICEYFIAAAVKSGDSVIDATAGNGYDTEKLSAAVGENGKVYAFDIQSAAIENAKKRDYKYDNVEFINASHSEMDKFVSEKVNFAIFNLGYLPGGDHEIMTKAESTVAAIGKTLGLLEHEGVAVIVIYSGGDTGFDESRAVSEYLVQVDYKKFNVLMFEYKNRPNNPPAVAVIQKK